MKNKFFYLLFSLYLFKISFIFANNPELITGELIIYNFSTTKIKVAVYPIGVAFNGNYKYNPNSIIFNPNYQYIYGGLKTDISISGTFALDQDRAFGDDGEASIGYGLYRIDFYEEDYPFYNYKTYCFADFRDHDYPYLFLNDSVFIADMHVYYYSENNIRFWADSLIPPDRVVKIWDQRNLNPLAFKLPNKNGFISDLSYLSYPIDLTLFGSSTHPGPGNLTLNLEIQNNHYAKINRGIPFSVNDSATLSLKHSDTYANNARLYVQNNSLFSVKPTATLEINKYGNVIIESGGVINLERNSNLLFRDHGEIIVDSGGTLNNCGAIISDTTFVCIIVHQQGHYNVGHQFCTHSAIHNFTKGAFLVLNGGDLTIGDSSKIVFDGSNSFLKINPQSRVFLGENASIDFINGAYISANGCTFNSIDSLKKWKGIVLENSGIDSIVNCTFSNAKTAITVKNTSGSFENRVIKNNTFNIPAGGNHKGIYGENNYNILIQDNIFNMPVVNQGGSPYYSGIFLKNSDSGEPGSAGQTEEEEMPYPYSLNIVQNSFKNGSVSVILANYLSNVLPYYVKGNTFDSAYSVGLLGLKITGTIRDNISSDFMTPLGIHLVNSSPNLYNNTVIARDVSLHLIGNCYPNLSPYIYANQLTWTGGKNRFTSQNYDNIQLVHPANVYTDFGENRFTIFDTASAYHIYGWLDSTITKYAGRNNCWYPANTAKIYLRHSLTGNPVSTVTGVTTLDCDHEIDPNGWSVDYLGNGIYDSVKQSANNTGNVPAEEDLIYEQAYNYMNQYLYLDAISSFKDLIDTYYDYEDLPKSAFDLYTSYEYLDTSLTQSERNTLFGNLKVYAEAKISSGNYKNEEFLDNCLDIITMCETKLENYDAAANNYEFIALYHPDPDIRLIASWNYAEIEALLNSGNGGGGAQLGIMNYQLGIEEQKELKEIQRLNEKISNDPILSRMKKTYEKISSSRKDETAKRIQQRYEGRSIGKTEKVNDYIRKSCELDNSKEIKAKRNLFELIELRNINPEELEKRRIEDMLLTMRIIDIESESDEVANLPFEYKLSQNYPNPFNPVTTIPPRRTSPFRNKGM